MLLSSPYDAKKNLWKAVVDTQKDRQIGAGAFKFGAGVFLGTQNSNSKVPSSYQIFIFGEVGGGGVILGYSKLQVPSSDQIFISGGGGELCQDSWQNEHKFCHTLEADTMSAETKTERELIMSYV